MPVGKKEEAEAEEDAEEANVGVARSMMGDVGVVVVVRCVYFVVSDMIVVETSDSDGK